MPTMLRLPNCETVSTSVPRATSLFGPPEAEVAMAGEVAMDNQVPQGGVETMQRGFRVGPTVAQGEPAATQATPPTVLQAVMAGTSQSPSIIVTPGC